MSNNKTDVKNKKKLLLKRICIITAIVFVLLAVFYFITKSLNDNVVQDHSFVEQLAEVYPTYTPFPAEWDADLSKDEDYLSFSPVIMYGEGESGSVYSLEDFYTTKDSGQKFFEEYFRILKEGDYENYPSLFTEKYKDTDASIRFEKHIDRQFPPQRVYDITVRKILSVQGTYDGKKCLRSVYWVDYKINKNSNLFRNDIGRENERDISRPLYFELVTFDEGTNKEVTLIHNMYTESSMKAFAEKNASAED